MSNIQVLKPGGGEVTVQGENFKQVPDVTPNDSDKTLTVPADKTWILQLLSATLVTTSTVGNRQLRVEIGDGTNLLWFKEFGGTQAADLTRNYYAASDLPDDTSFQTGGRIRMQLEAHVLPTGYTVRVYDVNAVDAAADDLTVRLVTDERGAHTML